MQASSISSSVTAQAQSLEATKAALGKELDIVRDKNEMLVNPELERLKGLIRACKDATVLSRESIRKETRRIDELIRSKSSVDAEVGRLEDSVTDLEHRLEESRAQPNLLAADLARRQKEVHAVQVELDSTSSKIADIEEETKVQSEKKDAAESRMKEEAIKQRECQSALDALRAEVGEAKKRHGDARLQVGRLQFHDCTTAWLSPTSAHVNLLFCSPATRSSLCANRSRIIHAETCQHYPTHEQRLDFGE